MNRRRGISLIEVLVAIFVMAIGLLAILAMFPLAAVKMANGIKDDRIAHAAANARAIAIARSLSINAPDAAFTNPGTGVTNVHADADPQSPSWAVYCDPIGLNSYSGLFSTWVASRNTDGIGRRSLGFIATPADRLKWCTLLDDITFGTNGQPAPSSGAVDRGGSYSWAWLLRRPKTGIRSVCELTVVVYTQRSLGAGIKLAGREVAYNTTLTDPTGSQTNLLTIQWNPGMPQPAVREGGWVFEMTPGPKDATNKWTPGKAKFHRVVTVGDIRTVGGVQMMDVELATSTFWTPRADGLQGPVIVTMEEVAEVFELGTGWRSWSN